MNVLRVLLIPWVLFFILAVSGIVIAGVDFHLQAKDHKLYTGALAAGVLLCLFANIQTLSKAGIWIAHSLPSSLRYNSWPWILRSGIAAVAAFFVYLLGQISWVPLFWQAFIIPAVFTIALFVGIWSLMGPILTWASKLSFGRSVAFIISWPVFALVPITAAFLGQNIVTAYLASRPDMVTIVKSKSAKSVAAAKVAKETAEKEAAPTVLESKAQGFHDLAESGKSCAEDNKEIQGALTSNGPEEAVFWAVKAVKCAELKAVVALPKLVKIMMEHPSPRVRAAAIMALPHFGEENVHRVAYLLFKRINDHESEEVLQAAAHVLARNGVEAVKSATNRLKGLLDHPKSGPIAAKVLINELKREDLVADYVADHLTGAPDVRERAVGMICVLPKASRTVAEPHIDLIVASVKTGSEKDPAMIALDCLGHPGFQAIREEVSKPQHLDRPVAARALAEMDIKSAPEALETAQDCVRDKNNEVRKWCSQSLGKIGAPALPKILDLLKSNDSDLKEAGKNALNFFDDPDAKVELERVRADNSGWMANKKKLQIAEAVSTALVRIENEEAQPPNDTIQK